MMRGTDANRVESSKLLLWKSFIQLPPKLPTTVHARVEEVVTELIDYRQFLDGSKRIQRAIASNKMTEVGAIKRNGMFRTNGVE